MNNKNSCQAKLTYDDKSDAMYVCPLIKKKIEFSEVIEDNLILDFSKNKNLIGIEILNATKVFNLSKLNLTNIRAGDFAIDITTNKIEFKIKLQFKLRNKLNQNVLSIEKLNLDLLAPSHINFAIS